MTHTIKKRFLLRVAIWVSLQIVFVATQGRAEGVSSGLTWHGYGELHYNNPDGSSVPKDDAPAQVDLHRMVWGLSYQWNDRISLHTELDFEHAFKEPELEFAYLDFLVNPAFNVRAGVVLMPVGPLNEFHEPPLFYSVERPYVQRTLIPTTWQEGGVGAFGTFSDFKYRAYVVSGLDGSGFSAANGIRGGRTGAGEAPSEGFAVTGRLEYIGVPGLTLGTSAYHGSADQTTDNSLDGVKVTLWEGDLRLRKAGFDLQAFYAQIGIGDAEQIVDGAGVPVGVGEKLMGHSIEVAYHLLPMLMKDTEQDVVPFLRWERFNTQEETPAAYTPDPKNDRSVFTYGVAYYPIPDVAVKADWQNWEDEAGADESRFNLGLAYMF